MQMDAALERLDAKEAAEQQKLKEEGERQRRAAEEQKRREETERQQASLRAYVEDEAEKGRFKRERRRIASAKKPQETELEPRSSSSGDPAATGTPSCRVRPPASAG